MPGAELFSVVALLMKRTRQAIEYEFHVSVAGQVMHGGGTRRSLEESRL